MYLITTSACAMYVIRGPDLRGGKVKLKVKVQVQVQV